jgi:cell division protein FtsZ
MLSSPLLTERNLSEFLPFKVIMPQVKPEIESFARIKVIGVGGSGRNAIEHMINSKVKGVEFVAINTDAQDLHHSSAKKKIHIGKNLTKGLGTGMNPELGKRAIEETKEEVQEAIKGADMVFITCGLGGGTGSGASPNVAQIAKEAGALTVAVVTKPFFFEGQLRTKIAEQALEELRKQVDAVIVIPNDRLLSNISKETTSKNAFIMCDDVLKQAVEGISYLITTPGQINVDFADIKAILKDAGSALMGIGVSNGEKRAEEAAKLAINSPLLDISINGARGVLFSVSGGEDITMFEIQDAAKVITESVDTEAKIIFGTIYDDSMKKGDIKVTVIASGFPEGTIGKRSLFSTGREERKEEENEEKQKKEEIKIFKKEDNNKKEENKKEEKSKLKEENDDDDDDDWSAVPAFLRRSKIK